MAESNFVAFAGTPASHPPSSLPWAPCEDLADSARSILEAR
jgi:hypothetical protein